MSVTYFVTKYGLSQGILEMPSGTKPVHGYEGRYLDVYGTFTTEWTTSREEAIAKVEKLRETKIENLRKKVIRVKGYK